VVEPKVSDLLVYLIEHRGRVASSEDLLDAVWPGINRQECAKRSPHRSGERALQGAGDPPNPSWRCNFVLPLMAWGAVGSSRQSSRKR